VVLGDGAVPPRTRLVKLLQDHVKAKIAPYKYPRSVKFTEALPKTQTGKIQRFRLRACHWRSFVRCEPQCRTISLSAAAFWQTKR
jgi:acyl-coenzyme A synthetase/AMP-(fatty) acid ligase